jgi:NTP pyrophosphatase (non-canonical NTP hydrolase)
MNFDEYQAQAARTDSLADKDALLVAFLGLGGEAGSLLTEYKKRLRDGPAHERFEATITEELGDILWYVSTVATRLKLDLSEIAAMNLAKTQERWDIKGGDDSPSPLLPDDGYPEHEQLPRKLLVRFSETTKKNRKVVSLAEETGGGVGDHLRDNAYEDDGYRFHDAVHLAFLSVLGWSPVFRKLLKRKRRSNPLTDEIEDGGRAVVIEEAVVAFAYDYGQRHGYLDGVQRLDYTFLKTVKSLTGGLEVARWSMRVWESAILQGFAAWRELRQYGGGLLVCDVAARRLSYQQ